jgi:hypothetical protein
MTGIPGRKAGGFSFDRHNLAALQTSCSNLEAMDDSKQDARIRKQVRQLISHSQGERLRERPVRPVDLTEKSSIPRPSLSERMRRLIARQKKS